MKLLLAVVAVIVTNIVSAQSVDDVQNANRTINDLINRDRQRIAGFVRLAFHDCVGAGGCDGCINLQNPSNNGLNVYIDPLDTAYVPFRNVMSRADFWALASLVALERATEGRLPNEKFYGSQFKVGRKDCGSSPNEDITTEAFPDATFNYDQVMEYFSNQFGFNARETIALLGAHTLGRARQANSGFEGPWIRGRREEMILDNKYYKEMIDVPWVSVSDRERNLKFQWQRPNTARNTPNNINSNMFFDSDVCLVADFGVDGNGQADCVMCGSRNRQTGRNCCGASRGIGISTAFAINNTLWVKEFTEVFYKMINKNLIVTPTEAPETQGPETEAPETQGPETEAPETQAPITRRPNRRGNRRGGRRRDEMSRLLKKFKQFEDEVEELKELFY